MSPRRTLFTIFVICALIGSVTVILLGALYKIQSWENPQWLPTEINILTIGTGSFLLTVLMAVVVYAAIASGKSTKLSNEDALELNDIPRQPAEVNAHAHRDEQGLL